MINLSCYVIRGIIIANYKLIKFSAHNQGEIHNHSTLDMQHFYGVPSTTEDC